MGHIDTLTTFDKRHSMQACECIVMWPFMLPDICHMPHSNVNVLNLTHSNQSEKLQNRVGLHNRMLSAPQLAVIT